MLKHALQLSTAYNVTILARDYRHREFLECSLSNSHNLEVVDANPDRIIVEVVTEQFIATRMDLRSARVRSSLGRTATLLIDHTTCSALLETLFRDVLASGADPQEIAQAILSLHAELHRWDE
jgi:hypothetical protein